MLGDRLTPNDIVLEPLETKATIIIIIKLVDWYSIQGQSHIESRIRWIIITTIGL